MTSVYSVIENLERFLDEQRKATEQPAWLTEPWFSLPVFGSMHLLQMILHGGATFGNREFCNFILLHGRSTSGKSTMKNVLYHGLHYMPRQSAFAPVIDLPSWMCSEFEVSQFVQHWKGATEPLHPSDQIDLSVGMAARALANFLVSRSASTGLEPPPGCRSANDMGKEVLEHSNKAPRRYNWIGVLLHDESTYGCSPSLVGKQAKDLENVEYQSPSKLRTPSHGRFPASLQPSILCWEEGRTIPSPQFPLCILTCEGGTHTSEFVTFLRTFFDQFPACILVSFSRGYFPIVDMTKEVLDDSMVRDISQHTRRAVHVMEWNPAQLLTTRNLLATTEGCFDIYANHIVEQILLKNLPSETPENELRFIQSAIMGYILSAARRSMGNFVLAVEQCKHLVNLSSGSIGDLAGSCTTGLAQFLNEETGETRLFQWVNKTPLRFGFETACVETFLKSVAENDKRQVLAKLAFACLSHTPMSVLFFIVRQAIRCAVLFPSDVPVQLLAMNSTRHLATINISTLRAFNRRIFSDEDPIRPTVKMCEMLLSYKPHRTTVEFGRQSSITLTSDESGENLTGMSTDCEPDRKRARLPDSNPLAGYANVQGVQFGAQFEDVTFASLCLQLLYLAIAFSPFPNGVPDIPTLFNLNSKASQPPTNSELPPLGGKKFRSVQVASSMTHQTYMDNDGDVSWQSFKELKSDQINSIIQSCRNMFGADILLLLNVGGQVVAIWIECKASLLESVGNPVDSKRSDRIRERTNELRRVLQGRCGLQLMDKNVLLCLTRFDTAGPRPTMPSHDNQYPSRENCMVVQPRCLRGLSAAAMVASASPLEYFHSCSRADCFDLRNRLSRAFVNSARATNWKCSEFIQET